MTSSGSNKASENHHHIILHWFRLGDLRLHDNPALVHSCQLASKKLVSRTSGATTSQQEAETLVLPWFHFDCQNSFGSSVETAWGSVKCGPRRAQFIVESVQDLQHQLQQECQCPLLVSHGVQAPHEFVSQLMQTISAGLNSDQQPTTKIQWTIICQEEVLQEEQDAVKAMRAIVPSSDDTRYNGVETVWGSTMYELDDVAELFGGNNLVDMPNSFTPFRNKVEKNCEIATPLASPRKLLQTLVPSPKNSRIGRALEPLMTRSQQVPSLKDLGYSDESIKMVETVDPRGVMQFRGGTSAALARVKDYIFTEDLLRVYFDTRNGMLGANYSTKLSPWLAHGCLSPRLVAQECRRYETERGIQNKSTYWLIFELLWRDYCKFFATKHGNKLFFPQGILDEKSHGASWWKMDSTVLAAWKDGRTGYPLVDANMRELQATGFMSNRGRQNVCSFLALDLQQDWRYGADFFESTLLDYDVYSNWYNWCAGAGMTGGRINRFNIVKQSKDYDQHGDYVRHWLPELASLPTEYIHEPWKMTHFQQVEYGVLLGKDYPHRLPTAKPPTPRDGGKQHNKKNGRPQSYDKKARKQNHYNRHQPFEMKSVKEGQVKFKK